MTAILNPIITDAGLAAAINANNNGLALAITHIALGTGQYDSSVNGPAMTALAALKEQVSVGAGTVAGTGACALAVRFESWTGTSYDATEIGFYAGDPTSGGVLFAVFSSTSDVIVERNLLDYIATFTLQLTRVPSGSVTVNVDAGAAQMLALLNLHLNAADPHTQYLKKAGDTATGYIKGLTAPRHDNAKNFATTEFVQTNGLRLSSLGVIGATTSSLVLAVSDLGRPVSVRDGGSTVVLPPLSGVPIGGSFIIRCAIESAIIQTTGTDVIATTDATDVTKIQLSRGDSIIITANGDNKYYAMVSATRSPVGMVSFFAGVSVPPGWLRLNGSILTRASYPGLFAYAQQYDGLITDSDWYASSLYGRFSAGDGNTTFRIPDLRGEFLRAWDNGRSVDTSRVIGSLQSSQNLLHNHPISDPGHSHGIYDPSHAHQQKRDDNTGTSGGAGNPDSNYGNLEYGATSYSTTGIGIYGALTGISTVSVGGNESRPRNVALNLCIKY